MIYINLINFIITYINIINLIIIYINLINLIIIYIIIINLIIIYINIIDIIIYINITNFIIIYININMTTNINMQLLLENNQKLSQINSAKNCNNSVYYTCTLSEKCVHKNCTLKLCIAILASRHISTLHAGKDSLLSLNIKISKMYADKDLAAKYGKSATPVCTP